MPAPATARWRAYAGAGCNVGCLLCYFLSGRAANLFACRFARAAADRAARARHLFVLTVALLCLLSARTLAPHRLRCITLAGASGTHPSKFHAPCIDARVVRIPVGAANARSRSSV